MSNLIRYPDSIRKERMTTNEGYEIMFPERNIKFGLCLLLIAGILFLYAFPGALKQVLSGDIVSGLSQVKTPSFKLFIVVAVLVNIFVSIITQYWQDMNLQSRTAQLSREILQFEAEHGRQEILPRPDKWDEDIRKMMLEAQEYNGQYRVRFAVRVMVVVDELKNRGLENTDLGPSALWVVNSLQMQPVGITLGALAQQLPKPEKWFSRRWALNLGLGLFFSVLAWFLVDAFVGQIAVLSSPSS